MTDIRLTGWRPDTCGCDVVYQWDNDLPPGQRVFTVHSVRRRCAAHSGLSDSALLTALLDQNRRKNHMYTLMAEALEYLDGEGYPDENAFVIAHQVTWWFTGSGSERVLHVSVANINQGQRNKAQKAADDYFGSGKVVIE